jgi:hypothetical protein
VSSHHIPVSNDTQKGAPLLPIARTEFSGHTPVDDLGVIVIRISIAEVGPRWMVRRVDLPKSHGSVSSFRRSTGITGRPLPDVTFIVVGGIVIVVHAMVLPPSLMVLSISPLHELGPIPFPLSSVGGGVIGAAFSPSDLFVPSSRPTTIHLTICLLTLILFPSRPFLSSLVYLSYFFWYSLCAKAE